jgi:hypothetical protein
LLVRIQPEEPIPLDHEELALLLLASLRSAAAFGGLSLSLNTLAVCRRGTTVRCAHRQLGTAFEYRMTFRWEQGHAYEVRVEDYH